MEKPMPPGQRLGGIEPFVRGFSVPAAYFGVFVHAEMLGNMGLCVTNGGTVIPYSHLFRKNRFLDLRRLSICRFLRKSIVPLACPLFDPARSNFFHWMFDSIPLIFAVEEYEKKFGKKVKFLIPKKIEHWQISSLKMMGLKEKDLIRLEVSWKSRVFFSELVLGSPCRYHPSSGAPEGALSPSTVLKLHKRLSGSLANSCDSPRIIYISRKYASSRRFLNEEEIISVVRKLGIEVVYCEKLTFEEQVQAFSHCDGVISIHGAGLTNILFSKRIRVVEIFSEGHGIRADYFQLARILGHEYYYHICESLNKDNDIYLSGGEFKNLLKESRLMIPGLEEKSS
ncbi:MAG: glycosyltransferase family 61 protein [Akkermansiaceae bacterium]|nr:glycosyltransferase family 61 protein [Akkermansiaceae bacterium]